MGVNMTNCGFRRRALARSLGEPEKGVMSRSMNRVWLLLLCFLGGEAFALGLGDIRLDSALNQPLRADIILISATPEELDNLTFELASSETFARYGIDRPFFLSRMHFQIIRSGGPTATLSA